MDELLLIGAVHTMDPQRPRAEAVLVRGGAIARVGSREECERAAAPAVRAVELPEGCITPGLVDAHGHAALYGRSLAEVDLTGCSSEADCVLRVAARAAVTPRGRWIRGGGWDQTAWPGGRFPALQALSAAVPDHPVLLWRVDLHAAWVNARALAECGLDRASRDPEGGRIVREDGAPTGLLIDTAAELVSRRIPQGSAEELEAAVLRGLTALRALGVTGLHDACAGPSLLQALGRLAARGALPIRVHAMVDGGCSDQELDARLAPFLESPEDGLLRVASVKLFADGALGSRGAALFDPYQDDSGNRGLWVTEPRELRRRILRLCGLGVQPAVHCIGDRACFEVLDSFAEAARTLGAARLRPRAEHLQLLRPRDAPLLLASGAVASMQPVHCVSDGRWAEERLGRGSERQRGAYAWRQAAGQGAVLALGSDVPVEAPDPRLGLAAAVLRTCSGAAAPWMPEQRLSLAEALRGFTWGAAYAEHAEHRRGMVREGLEADLTLWRRDPFALPEEQLAQVPLAGTVVAGQLALIGC
jgi:predicted amidohydrolase YtcJ